MNLPSATSGAQSLVYSFNSICNFFFVQNGANKFLLLLLLPLQRHPQPQDYEGHAIRGAECWTDHRLVRTILFPHIAQTHRDLDGRLTAHGPLTGCPTKRWESGKNTIGPRKPVNQDWFDENGENNKSLLDDKQEVFIEWQNDPSSLSKRHQFKHLQGQAQVYRKNTTAVRQQCAQHCDCENEHSVVAAKTSTTL